MRIAYNDTNFRAKLDVHGVRYNCPLWHKTAKIFEKRTKNLENVYDIRVWENDNTKMKIPMHEIIIEALPVYEQNTISKDIPNIEIQIADLKEREDCVSQGVTALMSQSPAEIAEKLIKFAAFAKGLVREYTDIFPEALKKYSESGKYYARGDERADWFSGKVNTFLKLNFGEEDAISITEVGTKAPWAEFLK